MALLSETVTFWIGFGLLGQRYTQPGEGRENSLKLTGFAKCFVCFCSHGKRVLISFQSIFTAKLKWERTLANLQPVLVKFGIHILLWSALEL